MQSTMQTNLSTQSKLQMSTGIQWTNNPLMYIHLCQIALSSWSHCSVVSVRVLSCPVSSAETVERQEGVRQQPGGGKLPTVYRQFSPPGDGQDRLQHGNYSRQRTSLAWDGWLVHSCTCFWWVRTCLKITRRIMTYKPKYYILMWHFNIMT